MLAFRQMWNQSRGGKIGDGKTPDEASLDSAGWVRQRLGLPEDSGPALRYLERIPLGTIWPGRK